MASVREIRIYPVKGLDPAAVQSVRVLASGALDQDRRFALADARGRFLNGKNWPGILKVRATFDMTRREVTIEGRTFSLEQEGRELAAWFSESFGEPFEWREDTLTGFPDDTVSPGPTLVSEASIEAVAAWFALDPAETRLRFRTNIEFTGLEPFAEDRWYGSAIRMGDVTVNGINPCARCTVPSRNPFDGSPDAGFQKRFAELRKQHLPAWAHARLFDHHYRFTVNTRIPASEAGKTIRVGDEIAE